MSNGPSPVLLSGAELPAVSVAPPGPESVAWLRRFAGVAAPMGPRAAWQEPQPGLGGTIVYRAAQGSNVVDVDGNRYVDLAAGFGSLLLGHNPAAVQRALVAQSAQLWQALGDVHPSALKIELQEHLAFRFGGPGVQSILAQSGADAVSAALKTAALFTGKPGVVAFAGAYHGLSYGPLAACGLRESYRAPFAAQLNPAVRFVEYPGDGEGLQRALGQLERELARGDVGAILYEPILGRGGCVVPPRELGAALAERARAAGCLLIADEIWTGLGRAGQWLYGRAHGPAADLVCLGKGLGGGLPISACLGRAEVLAAWSRAEEVVHTSTFAGAPLSCAAALATLSELSEQGLVERSERLGESFRTALAAAIAPHAAALGAELRGAGLMIGLELGRRSGAALELTRRLLARGYVTSLGGGRRETLVLTPALNISEALLEGFVQALADSLPGLAA